MNLYDLIYHRLNKKCQAQWDKTPQVTSSAWREAVNTDGFLHVGAGCSINGKGFYVTVFNLAEIRIEKAAEWRKIMDQHNISQVDLSIQMGVCPSYISRIFRGLEGLTDNTCDKVGAALLEVRRKKDEGRYYDDLRAAKRINVIPELGQ